MIPRKALPSLSILPALTAILILGVSCSKPKLEITLRLDPGKPGTMLIYKQTYTQVGSVYRGDTITKEINRKSDADVTYTTEEILPNGKALIQERDVWSWDEMSDDSDKVTRQVKEDMLTFEVAPNGKIVDFTIEDDKSSSYESYLRNYLEQGQPVFPEEKVSQGYSWTQKSTLELPDRNPIEASTTYTVKGMARKMGYDCVIIEYAGNMAIPLYPDPADSTAKQGLDKINVSGVMYHAYKKGVLVSQDEKREIVSQRTRIEKGQADSYRVELTAMLTVSLVDIEEI
jgi:hypothetical protein